MANEPFELDVLEYVDVIDPAEYGIEGVVGIDPRYYFITSGDAVEKAKVLERNLRSLAGVVRHRLSKLAKQAGIKSMSYAYKRGKMSGDVKKYYEFCKAVDREAGRARKLVNKLKEVRGDNCFLETEWINHVLICVAKNPRR